MLGCEHTGLSVLIDGTVLVLASTHLLPLHCMLFAVITAKAAFVQSLCFIAGLSDS